MGDENPPKEKTFDEFYSESLGLLKSVLDNIDRQPTHSTAPMSEILKRLELMDREFGQFLEENKDVFALLEGQGESTEAQVPKSVLRLLKKSEDLKARAEKKMQEIVETEKAMRSLAQEEDKKEAPPAKKHSKKEAVRKNKFRRIGGVRDWKPL